MKQNKTHTPVLLQESIKGLDIITANTYIDATIGMGGHTFAFLSKNPNLIAKGFDQDKQARDQATLRLKKFIDEKRCEIIPENFEKIEEICNEKNFFPDAILFDIGVSSLQFDTPERGFSFRFNAPLDMRMNQDNPLTAEIILNTWSQKKLEKIFIEYGEEPLGKYIAKKIVEKRIHHPFLTTFQLSDFISQIKPFKKQRKKNSGGHPAVLIFQALRIAVNRELEVLETALHSAIKILKKGGKIAVITFHSLEDKKVKNIFSSYEEKGKKQKYPKIKTSENSEVSTKNKIILSKVNKKPITPSTKEILENPRSRSAKLRIMQKI